MCSQSTATDFLRDNERRAWCKTSIFITTTAIGPYNVAILGLDCFLVLTRRVTSNATAQLVINISAPLVVSIAVARLCDAFRQLWALPLHVESSELCTNFAEHPPDSGPERIRSPCIALLNIISARNYRQASLCRPGPYIKTRFSRIEVCGVDFFFRCPQ